MKLIVGLGNPGREHAAQRHNAGFMVLDELARRAGLSFSQKFKGEHAKGTLVGAPVVLLKPQTYMNLSGTSVGLCASFYGVTPGDTLVIHDELDAPFGEVPISGGNTAMVWAGNLAGLPAVFLPVGLSTEGLPVSIAVVGPGWADALVLAVGVAFQGITDFHRLVPPFAPAA